MEKALLVFLLVQNTILALEFINNPATTDVNYFNDSINKQPLITFPVMPFETGNVWSFRVIYIGGRTSVSNIEIVGDTILSNGHNYFVLNYNGPQTELIALFLRSDSGIVYYYDSYDSSESPVLNLTADPQDEWDSYYTSYSTIRLTEVTPASIFEQEDSVYEFGLGGLAFAIIRFSSRFGFIRTEEYGDLSPAIPNTTFDLTGCIIADTTYGIISSINDSELILPSDYNLNQNFPNPFNPATNIEYSIPISGYVSITVYNSLGQEIKKLVDDFKTAGNYQVTFSEDNLASGVYYYRMVSGKFMETKKLIYLK